MFAILFFAWASYIEQSNRKNIKILKRKSDDELQILEKPVKKKKQIFLNSYFSCSSCFNKVNNNSKTKKTSSWVPWLLKYKNVEENWIRESSAAFNARIWLLYNKDEEYSTNSCVHNSKSTLKE